MPRARTSDAFSVAAASYKGDFVKLPNGIRVGLRRSDRSGLTIGIDVPLETDEEDVFSLEISVRATLWYTFTTDLVGVEWLADEDADVGLDRAAETLFRG